MGQWGQQNNLKAFKHEAKKALNIIVARAEKLSSFIFKFLTAL